MVVTNETYYFDMDGVIANFHKEPYKYVNAINRKWIASLEPFMHNVNLIKDLIANGNNVYILTKAASEQAKLGKLDWLKKYIPEIPVCKVIVIVGNGKKVDYIQEDGILVDDDKKNVNPWIKAGHKAILVENKGDMVVI